MSESGTAPRMTFWEHLDALRAVLMRVVVAMVVLGVVAFVYKEQLFAVILAPKQSDFMMFRWLAAAGQWLGVSGMEMAPFDVRLISTQLTQQFVTHIKMALLAGFLLTFPYILYEVFRFVSPALYVRERRYALRFILSGYVMFMVGVAMSYFVIFPLTFRFLATYQVSVEVENHIVLESYIGTMMMLNLMMGILFEMPVLSWLFAKMGFLSAAFLRNYRRHAIVILLFVAAIITPTSDVFTLLLVAIPIYLLYEVSIWIVALSNRA